ncbi:MAG: T9SS type A sorting domain-containing protein [Ignavibacteria bacterium]|nr:T9SS type A sorting domain-containing protein [Ignavibacteria bacterium]
MRKAIVVIVGLLAGSMQISAQGWKQIYPSWPVDEYSSIFRGGGDTLYIAGLNFTLLRSTDKGEHWEHLFRSPGALNIQKAGFDGETIFLLPGGRPYYDALLADTTTGFLFALNPATNDTNRISFPTGFPQSRGAFIQVDLCVASHAVYVLATAALSKKWDMRLLRSVDRGNTWSPVPLPDSVESFRTSVSFRDSVRGLLWAGNKADYIRILYSTQDGGASWKRHEQVKYVPGSKNQEMPMGMPIVWIDDSTAVLSTGGGGLHITRDGGDTWALVNPMEPTIPAWIGMGRDGAGFMGGFSWDVYRTTDFGATWANVRAPSMQFACSQASMPDAATLVLIEQNGDRIHTSDGGLTWNNDQVKELTSISNPTFVSNSVGYAAGSWNGLPVTSGQYRTTDEGRTWQPYPGPGNAWWYMYHVSDRVSYAYINRSTLRDTLVCRTTNAGATWQVCILDTIAKFEPVFPPGSGMHRGNDTLFIFTSDSCMMRTTNGGTSWTTYPSLPYRFTGFYVSIRGMDMRRRLYSWAISNNKVFRSSNDGVSWDTVFTCPEKAGAFAELKVHGTDVVRVLGEESVYGMPPGVTGTVYTTTDAGASWTSAYAYGIDTRYFCQLWPDGDGYGQYSAMSYIDYGSYYAFRSTSDFWTTWTERFRLNSRGGVQLYFRDRNTGWAMINGAVYHTSTGGIDAADTPPEPASLALSQNYPNPFSTHTTIPYSIAGSGAQQLSIELYDAMGRRVATLYDGTASAGEHVLPFDASGFVPGMYFVRLVTGGKTEVRKMVVVGGGR